VACAYGMVACRHNDCDADLKSERGRSIHEARVHGEVLRSEEWDDKQYLQEQYLENGKTIKQISEENNVPYNSIQSAIHDHDIETRGTNATRYFDRREMLRESIEDIMNEYLEEGTPMYKIADEYGVNDATIARWLQKHGVDTRDIQEQNLRSSDYPELLDYDWLWENYREKERYTPELAEELGCCDATVLNALYRHNIPVWDHGETIEGEKHPRWVENPEYNYGPNWQEQRRKAIEEGDEQCRACGMSRQEHRDKYGRDIQVHHIIPLRKFDEPKNANKLSNLTPLCSGCHRRYEGLPVVPQRNESK